MTELKHLLKATDEMIAVTDCPWCSAGPGERCYGRYVNDRPSRLLSDTHSARFKDVGSNRVRPLPQRRVGASYDG